MAREWLKRVAEIAKDVAPYMHAKKATAPEQNGLNGESVEDHITIEFVKEQRRYHDDNR
jgi:hypothetical protein